MRAVSCLCWAVMIFLQRGLSADALSCMCRKSRCEPPTNCTAGAVLDACSCCYECARTINQTCGGPFHLMGTCANGLYCETSVEADERAFAAPTEIDAGVCVPCKGPMHHGCDLIDGRTCQCGESCTAEFRFASLSTCLAEVAARLQGPAAEPRQHGLPSGSTTPSARDVLLSDVLQGDAGSCLDVVCPDYEEVPSDCPADSWRRPLTEPSVLEVCCGMQGLTSECVCKEPLVCPAPPMCDTGLLPVEALAADGRPGSCCALYRCANVTSLQCEFEGIKFEHGAEVPVAAVASGDDALCQSCFCLEGVVLCRPVMECVPVPSTCSWMGVAEGECCPTCRGCVSRSTLAFHAIGESWLEDDCTSCDCDVGGVARCFASACVAPRCARPVKVPGRCCPLCSGDSDVDLDDGGRIDVFNFDGGENATSSMASEATTTTTFTTATSAGCPALMSCNVSCNYGLQQDSYGCPVCKCQEAISAHPHPSTTSERWSNDTIPTKLPANNCTLGRCGNKTCSTGFELDRNGCQTCDCRTCPQAACNVSCPKGAYELDGNGCPTCKCRPGATPDAEWHGKVTDLGRCFASLGHPRRDGETWFDGCRECFCDNGKELCSLITCPIPLCERPVMAIGQCCPICPESSSQPARPVNITTGCPSARYREDGSLTSTDDVPEERREPWRLDACSVCVCHQGHALCETERCPPILCEQPIHIAGRCCPACSDSPTSYWPAAIATLPSYRQGCSSLINGRTYRHGDVWRSSDCQSCTCQHGQLHCFSQTCAAVGHGGGSCISAVLRKGQCCPICTANADPHPRVCLVNGQVIRHGQEWTTLCSHCFCYYGSPQCTPRPCSQLRSQMVGCSSTSTGVSSAAGVILHGSREDYGCCQHCLDVGDRSSGGDTSPAASVPGSEMAVMTTLAVLLCLFAGVIVVLVVVVIRRTKRRTALTTLSSVTPELHVESPPINNRPVELALLRAHESATAAGSTNPKRPKSTNLEFYVGSFRYNNNALKDKDCCKPLVDGGRTRNEYAIC